MGMTIEHAKKLLTVIVASISKDDDCFTIEDENVQVFKSALLVLLEAVKAVNGMPTVEAIPKADYENRLKTDKVAMLTELQLEIKELWDSRYDVWLDNQYYVGKDDTLGEVDEVIQEKIDKLKENINK